jgi:hypothetical protein
MKLIAVQKRQVIEHVPEHRLEEAIKKGWERIVLKETPQDLTPPGGDKPKKQAKETS